MPVLSLCQCIVYIKVFVLEHVEYYSYPAPRRKLIFAHCPHGYLGRLALRKPEHAGGNTAKRNAFTDVFLGKLQALFITARKLFAVLFGGSPVCYRTDRVNNVFARQVKSRGYLRPACRLGVPLRVYYPVARNSKLNSGIGMNAVVNAVVKRAPTAP